MRSTPHCGTVHPLIRGRFLHPAGLATSYANDEFGNQQVGSGWGVGIPEHAFLWNGTAASVVDLNPAGRPWSRVLGTSGTTQVGEAEAGSFISTPHAYLWHGTAASAIDLHLTFGPGAIYEAPHIYAAVWGSTQVGVARPETGLRFAVMWNGTAESMVLLHPTNQSYSTAYSLLQYSSRYAAG